ncbi:MAG: SDR family oxidoreductase [Marinilabiliales bacterium]
MERKVVIVTGASSGIGKALALDCANRNMNVVIAARRIDKLNDLKIELEKKGIEVLALQTDVTNEQDCENLINETVKKFGKIDILINNAGISMKALFEKMELDVLRKVMDVNFWGTVYCSKYALPYLLQTKGSLVGIISIGGHVGLPGRTGYSASKFAVRGFLDTVRTENLKKGLHVLIAAPGFTASEIREKALLENGQQQGKTPRKEEKMMSAEEAAKKINNAILKRKRQLILTFVEGKLLVFLNKFFPGFTEKMVFKSFAKEPDSPLK